MKRTEAKRVLAGKDEAALATELEALLKEQFGLRMQSATQQLANTAKLRDVRRSIARVKTLMTRKAGAAGQSAPAARGKEGARA